MGVSIEKQNEDAIYEIPENAISLKDFPPKVRKVIKHILETDSPCTMKAACAAVGVKYESFRTQVTKARKKGHDIRKFIDEQASTFLHEQKYAVHTALVNGAVSDSHADRKLYFQLTGDLKEQTNIQHNITLNMGFIPASSGGQDHRKSGVIDTKPFIPSLPDKSK